MLETYWKPFEWIAECPVCNKASFFSFEAEEKEINCKCGCTFLAKVNNNCKSYCIDN